ncbi:hypothetical protein FPANT_9363 [Fusarium pseudoanthophilum]|uniref:Transcription factor domain-containing protein n=1 Tax=Fusarium pseudoanthophilum TaxID=48495 RepID=A0A8H5KV02_9HYPO|nr:hypothetical protein FPANT_9363 [Fusarium pseudoanthophilum]
MRETSQPAYCRPEGSTTSLARVEDLAASNAVIRFNDSPAPVSAPPQPRPLSQLGPCGWDLTEYGQAELMQAMFAYHYPIFPDQLSQGRLKQLVDVILQERGWPLETMLEDEVLESFPLVEYDRLDEYAAEDKGLSMPGLILAILLVTMSPCNHVTCAQTKRLYLTLLAFLPILQSQLLHHNGVIRIQGLVAVYEYGHGLYDQAHLSLNSAICMASKIKMDLQHLELSLEWRLSLMMLDCCLLLHRAHLFTTCQPGKLLEFDQEVALRSSRAYTWKLVKNVLRSYSDDDPQMESLISLMPCMTSLCFIANDPPDDSVVEEIAAMMPYIRKSAKRWTGLRPFANRIARNAGLDAHVVAEFDLPYT